jgi:sulfatase maturation enzyme AslB (radical SAM superfamily)
MDTNTFCKHLSNGYRIYIDNNQNITYMPCCYWQGPARPFTNLIQDRKFLNNSTPWAHNECNKCRNEEKYKENNYRVAGNKIMSNDLPSTKVGWLDIQADTTCNGGCLICGPWNSSYWQNELSKYNEFKLIPATNSLRQSVDKIFSEIDVSELRQLQFLGGEPFLSAADTYAFDYITCPEICQLKYTTNGSIYPKSERIANWSQFKSVLINFSIDGVGDRFDYLRYPLKWNTVHKNVLRFINEAPDNLVFHINHSVTPLNIFYYQEFMDWVDATFPKEQFKGIHVHPAYGIMSVANSSNKLRELVLDKYGKDHIMAKMLRENRLIDNQNFLNYINTWDSRRGTKWQTVFAEIANCF